MNTTAKNEKLNSAKECNKNEKNITPKFVLLKKSKPNAYPNEVKTRETKAEIMAYVMYHEEYHDSRRSPIKYIYRRSCFSFSPTREFIAINIAGRDVTMKKTEGPKDAVRESGTRVRARVGNGRSDMLNVVG